MVQNDIHKFSHKQYIEQTQKDTRRLPVVERIFFKPETLSFQYLWHSI